MTDLKTQAVALVNADAVMDTLGWTVNVNDLPALRHFFLHKANEIQLQIEAYNASCEYDADAPEDKIEGFETMDRHEYFDRFYGPNPRGLA